MSGGSGTGTPAVAVSTSQTVATRGGAPFVLERVSNPAVEPITLAEIIEHVREFTSISQAAQDELTGLITGAREWVEDYTGRATIDQTWRITINGAYIAGADAVTGYASVPGYSAVGWQWWQRRGEILLRKSPILAITSFVSADSAGTETTIDPATYALCEPDSKWPRIVALSGASWTSGALKIEFRAGFVDRSGSPIVGAVPVRFLQAMKLWVSAMYDRDEKMMALLLDTAHNIIKPERSELQLA